MLIVHNILIVHHFATFLKDKIIFSYFNWCTVMACCETILYAHIDVGTVRFTHILPLIHSLTYLMDELS